MYDLQFTPSAEHFSAQAHGYLAEHPVVENVVATTAQRAIREDAEGVIRPPDRPWWFCVIRDGEGQIAGVAMRTAPAPEYAVWVGGLPADAADALADQLIDRGEAISVITGSQPPARVLADRMADAIAGRVSIRQRTRLFELGELVPPTGVSGNIRPATQDDLDLVHRWRDVFLAEAEEQAGRPVTSYVATDPEETRRRIRDHQFWLWEDAGQVVHLTGASPPSSGVARIAPVYTPKPFRGNGYAMAAVAAVSQLLVDQRARVCLFTDQANPVSNRIYQRIGYRPVADMEQLIIE
ncbi:GNAT family N-acetyltransferase [Microlunatus sp. Gsoil 973]|jgi:RimJ/RimL family protein N-acetyltransferase|uniref:GNAT family N-acetyltransferase n=1 Tax=Microlunatus sp. Gsoil 973 TaxID=2672569 RepID=UPI0012B49F82|nr:GNAT family N-acetyltransferase [Microlunatus sp. Gsoil 973]QGN33295.1 GNAT family N-acetyltransferase [Microlunatus sp. Gsoil 973]